MLVFLQNFSRKLYFIKQLFSIATHAHNKYSITNSNIILFLCRCITTIAFVAFLFCYIMSSMGQNTQAVEGQIKYLVYCMENAIWNLNPGQEQMVWLIDFQGWNMGCLSVKVTRETARVLQDRYPERLGLAILYNPPKVFESFWLVGYNTVPPFFFFFFLEDIQFLYCIRYNFFVPYVELAVGETIS